MAEEQVANPVTVVQSIHLPFWRKNPEAQVRANVEFWQVRMLGLVELQGTQVPFYR